MGSIKVNKKTAEKLINNGYTIKMIPCNFRLGNIYFEPTYVNAEKLKTYNTTFDKFLNEYIFYNCNADMGKYPHYYLSMDFTLDSYTAGCYNYDEAIQLYEQIEKRCLE